MLKDNETGNVKRKKNLERGDLVKREERNGLERDTVQRFISIAILWKILAMYNGMVKFENE